MRATHRARHRPRGDRGGDQRPARSSSTLRSATGRESSKCCGLQRVILCSSHSAKFGGGIGGVDGVSEGELGGGVDSVSASL
jgi:hypothetical protein